MPIPREFPTKLSQAQRKTLTEQSCSLQGELTARNWLESLHPQIVTTPRNVEPIPPQAPGGSPDITVRSFARWASLLWLRDEVSCLVFFCRIEDRLHALIGGDADQVKDPWLWAVLFG